MPDVWWTYNNISSRSTPNNRHEQSLAFPFLWLIFLTPSPYIYWKPTPFPPPSLTASLTFVFPAPRTFQTLSPTDTLPSLSDTINYIHTHARTHTHVYTRWCVCFCSVIFQWGVFGGWFWSGWCFCLKTSNWVIAGNRRRRRSSSSKPGKANSGWVRSSTLLFHICSSQSNMMKLVVWVLFSFC